jgi:hypothetical protein
MPKSKLSLPPRIEAPCPNPLCSSGARVFRNLQKHISQKPECMDYLQAYRQEQLLKYTQLQHDANLLSQAVGSDVCQFIEPAATAPPIDNDVVMDNDFPMDDVFPAYDDIPNGGAFSPPLLDDFEQINFNQYIGPNELEAIVTPSSPLYTNSRRIEVTLLKILTELEAPLWAFKIIMNWAFDAAQSGYNFMPQQESYRSQLQTITKWVKMEHMQPTVMQVSLPGARPDDVIPVTTFDFVSQLHSLLSDNELNQPQNLVINHDNPFSRYTSPDGRLKEALSGSWYNNAWNFMEANTNCNFMIPIILYIDKTQISITGKLSIFPVQMSLSIFTEEARRTSRAWRPLGYIANEDFYYSSAEIKANNADTKNERFHRQLEVILKSFYNAQEPNALFDIPIKLGNIGKRVNLYVPLQFIIGDADGGDGLCSRWTYRGKACLRLCRTCDVSTANAGRTDLPCSRICVADVQQLILTGTKDDLDALAQRPGFNALYKIDCGGDPYGVFSMIHTEGLHALEVGLIPYMLEILFKELSKKAKQELDTLVKRLLKHPKQHGYKPFPRLIWQDGVTGMKRLTGDQRVGKMFAIVATALTLEGEKFFTKRLKGGFEVWKKMTYVFQQILCYWAWLKQDTYWMANDQAACADASASIKIMLAQIQTLWPRKDGLHWNLTKLHEQMHVPVDIQRHGNHKNVHTGPQEHNHIDIKNASKKTQLNKKKMDIQTGYRVMERLVIQRAYDFVKQENSEPVQFGLGVQNASKGTYRLSSNTSMGTGSVDVSFKWHRQKYDGCEPLLQEHIMGLLVTSLFHAYATPSTLDISSSVLDVEFFTEYERNRFVYRGHPNYRGAGQYYDWAQVKWEIGETIVTGEPIYKNYIGRIHGFIRHPDGDVYAIIHSTIDNVPIPIKEHGVFGHYWHLEFEGTDTNHRPILQLVHVDCLLEHVCMIPYYEQDPFCWVHLWDPLEWPGCFQTILPPGEE